MAKSEHDITLLREARLALKETNEKMQTTLGVTAQTPVDVSAVTDKSIFDLPPVDDEEYMPRTLEELCRASYALSKKVPIDKISIFYKELKELLEETFAKEEKEMGVNESLRLKLRMLIKEELEADDDFDLDDEDEEISPEEIEAERKAAWKRAKDSTKDRKFWDEIKLKPKKRKNAYEMFDDANPDYDAKSAGDYGVYTPYEKIADKVEGLNTPSAVRQFLADPRRVNLMDKVKFLLDMPKKEQKKILVQAGADYITKLSKGKADPIDYKDPVIANAVKDYVGTLSDEGILDDSEAQAMLNRSEFVVELDTFLSYLVNYFDMNFDELISYTPFRMHLKKYWARAMRADPELKKSVEVRKQEDIARAKAKKAARKK